MTKIKIITDSVADIPNELLEEWQIGIIPTFVNYNGQSYADDGSELDRTEFYQQLPAMKEFPTTAAPPPLIAQEILEREFEGYDHIIGIHVPSRYSVTMNNIRLGSLASHLPSDCVTLIDSGTLTMAIGRQALVAAKVAKETHDVQAVVDAVEKVRQSQKLYAIIATMEYLHRSGRVNSLVATMGSLLRIKPLIEVYNGDIIPRQRIRTMKKATNRLIERIRQCAPLDSLTILHIQNEAGAQDLHQRLSDIAPPNTRLIEVGPTLGTHLGLGSVGATFLPQNWDK